MVSKELLNILCCPETKQSVALIDNATVQKVNDGIKSQTISNRAGTIIKEEIGDGLLREDGKFLYPIREDIPIMLIDEAIPFEK